MIKNENIIFGLDIGTRNVVGIVAQRVDDKLVIKDWEVVEHAPRAMIDGQIHDIMKVADTISKVKVILEERQNMTLKEVSIAAAGRVLKTITINTFIDFDEEQEIGKHHIQSLELNGVEQAQKSIGEQTEGDFFCVGYNVVTYYLNDYEIENLEAHKAKRIGIKILATFLPQVVIDSLYTSVHKTGLTVDHLSLEPIAAINAAIPKSYRMLNLALVDIGAGTSDIAITKNGSVFAYGMIPMAGDEMTEKLVHKYLIDFDTAEKMKIATYDQEKIRYKDILSMDHEVNTKTVLKQLKPVIDQITSAIADEIIKLNGNQSPNAIFCVGGGGQLQGFIELLAKKLGLPKERVVLKGVNDLLNVTFDCEAFVDPSMVTPVGICTTAMENQKDNFCEVILNDEKVKLLNARELTVMDAALKHGYDYSNLMARKGKDLHFTLNGAKKRVKGQLGEPAEIYVNNKEANLHTVIREGDYIIIKEAINGQDAKAKLNEFVVFQSSFIVNGIEQEISLPIFVNGDVVLNNCDIQPQDHIQFEEILTLADLSKYFEMPLESTFYINGIEEHIDAPIKRGDYVEYSIDDNITATTFEEVAVSENVEQQSTPVVVEEKSWTTDGSLDFIVVVNGDTVMLQGKTDYIYVDIFEFYPFDLANPKGKIRLKLNGKEAAYTDPLGPNDQLDIYWE
ncbi:cell division protein FtsA [Vallitalea okinawensis]|uniref:cell division protein FtsA n=1 Tax=Vallitalea okinawensis TaxID=2078660 RepID=UPI0013003492|nr:cell division protein FtsA [Vallitalea okinawensis]